MSEVKHTLAGVDRVIHEPARSSILSILSKSEYSDFISLQRESGLTKGNLSAHLARLAEAGYIEIEKTYRGRVPLTLCRMTDLGRQALETYRERLRMFVGK